MAAATGVTAMQAQLDEDMAALMDNFEGLLRCAQARGGAARRSANPVGSLPAALRTPRASRCAMRARERAACAAGIRMARGR